MRSPSNQSQLLRAVPPCLLLAFLTCPAILCAALESSNAQPVAPAATPLTGASSGGWRAIASTPLGGVLTQFEIAGRTCRLDRDLPHIVRHYQQRPSHAYTIRWSQRNALGEQQTLRGMALLQKGHFHYGSYAPVPLALSSLKWNEDPFSNLNWQWYHHQLMSVHYLLAVAQKEGNSKAIDAASQIVRSWAAANYTTPFPSPQSWNDHSTAYRLRTLICLFEHLRVHSAADTEFLGLLLQMIDTHCRVLAEEKFFVRHTNHGLDQATILFWAASAFPELAEAEGWRRLSLDRLREEVSFMFSREGIHVENSPSYHVWMLDALQELMLMSEEMKRADFEWILNMGWEYAAHALQPNGRFPLVGDTESIDFSMVRASRPFPGCQHYLYSATAGKAGTKPDLTDAIFPLTGYAVFRDRWHDSRSFSNTVYLFFKCSFLANYHRHDDDLNVVLFAFGEEWLIDAGLYGYEKDDPLRRYVVSPDAHNTVVVQGRTTIRDVAKMPKPGSRIVEYGVERPRSFVTGESLMYEGVLVERRLEYLKPDRIVLRDSVSSLAGKPSTYPSFTVQFHVPSDKGISLQPDNQVVVSSTNGHRLLLASDPAPRRVSLISGASDGQSGLGSWVSKAITRIEPSQCVRFEFTGTESSTCTLTLKPRTSGVVRTATP